MIRVTDDADERKLVVELSNDRVVRMPYKIDERGLLTFTLTPEALGDLIAMANAQQ